MSTPLANDVPLEYGKIQECFNGQSGKMVFFIQDAHDSLEAQENIARIIEAAVERNEIITVFEEGYEGLVPSDQYFKAAGSPETKKKISYYWMDKLRLGGADYAHINRKKDFRLIGIDDLGLYQKNLQAFRLHAATKEAAEQGLKTFTNELEKLAQQHFPAEVKQWLKTKKHLDQGELPMLDYVKRLLAGIAWKNPAEREQSLPALSILAAPQPASLEKMKTVTSNPGQIFEEIERAEDRFIQGHLTFERDLKIYEMIQTFSLFEKLIRLKMSETEYRYAREKMKDLNLAKAAEWIARTAQKSKLFSLAWQAEIETALNFYEIAQARDQAVKSRLKKFFEDSGEHKAVLVFGGFHREPITDFLKSEQISYAVISPVVTVRSPKHERLYERLMAEEPFSNEMAFPKKAAAALKIWLEPGGRALNDEALEILGRPGMERLPQEILGRILDRELPNRRNEARPAGSDTQAAVDTVKKLISLFDNVLDQTSAYSPDEKEGFANIHQKLNFIKEELRGDYPWEVISVLESIEPLIPVSQRYDKAREIYHRLKEAAKKMAPRRAEHRSDASKSGKADPRRIVTLSEREIQAMPAYSILKTLELLPYQAEADQAAGEFFVKRLDWGMRGEGPLRGLDIIRRELTETAAQVELLYRAVPGKKQKKLIAVIPVLSETDLERGMQAIWLNLSPYYFEIPRSGHPAQAAEWAQLAAQIQQDQKAVWNYLGDKQSHYHLFKNQHQEPYGYAEIDRKTGEFFIQQFSPENFNPARYSHAWPGLEQLIFPVFPTVYSPAVFQDIDRGYHASLYPAEKNLGTSKDPLALRQGMKILVGGAGSGFDTYLLMLALKRKKIAPEVINKMLYAFDKNPLAVANTEYLAKLAGFEVQTKIHDNVMSAQGLLVFPSVLFDRFVWNMPESSSEAPLKNETAPFSALWDGDSGKVLERLGEGLIQILTADGLGLIWNSQRASSKLRKMKSLQITTLRKTSPDAFTDNAPYFKMSEENASAVYLIRRKEGAERPEMRQRERPVEQKKNQLSLLPLVKAGKMVDGVFSPMQQIRSEEDWGIADFKTMKKAIDLAQKLKMSLVQLLPVNLPNAFNSPYSPASSKLISPANISVEGWIETLAAYGVQAAEIPGYLKFLSDYDQEIARLRSGDEVDYDAIFALKKRGLQIVWNWFEKKAPAEIQEKFKIYQTENADWLEDHLLYVVLKEKYTEERPASGWDWRTWPKAVRDRDRDALKKIKKEYQSELLFRAFIQFVADQQFDELARYGAEKKVDLMEDIPLALDGADIWIRPEIFGLKKENGFKRLVSQGVPGDAFTDFGQYWQFFPYDFNHPDTKPFLLELFRHKQKRVRYVRLDHVLGFYRQYFFLEDPEQKITLENLGIWSSIDGIRDSALRGNISREEAVTQVLERIRECLIRLRELKRKGTLLDQDAATNRRLRSLLNAMPEDALELLMDENGMLREDSMLTLFRTIPEAELAHNPEDTSVWKREFRVELQRNEEYTPLAQGTRESYRRYVYRYLFPEKGKQPNASDRLSFGYFKLAPGEGLLSDYLRLAQEEGTVLIWEVLGAVPPAIKASVKRIASAYAYVPIIWGIHPRDPYHPKEAVPSSYVTFDLHDSPGIRERWEKELSWNQKKEILETFFGRGGYDDGDLRFLTPRVHKELLKMVYAPWLYAQSPDQKKILMAVITWNALLGLPDVDPEGHPRRLNMPGMGQGQWGNRLPSFASIEDLLNAADGKSSSKEAKAAIQLLRELQSIRYEKEKSDQVQTLYRSDPDIGLPVMQIRQSREEDLEKNPFMADAYTNDSVRDVTLVIQDENHQEAARIPLDVTAENKDAGLRRWTGFWAPEIAAVSGRHFAHFSFHYEITKAGGEKEISQQGHFVWADKEADLNPLSNQYALKDFVSRWQEQAASESRSEYRESLSELKTMEEKWVVMNFDEMKDPENPEQFSETQIGEALALAAAAQGKIRISIYQADIASPVYGQLKDIISLIESRDPKLKGKIQLMDKDLSALYASSLHSFQGKKIFFFKGNSRDFKTLQNSGLAGKFLMFRAQDRTGELIKGAGTLGVALSSSDEIKESTARALLQNLPEGVLWNPEGYYFPSEARLGVWSKLLEASYLVVFARSA